MIGRLKCRVGLHNGNVLTAHEIDDQLNEEIDGRFAFVCSRCSKVIE